MMLVQIGVILCAIAMNLSGEWFVYEGVLLWVQIGTLVVDTWTPKNLGDYLTPWRFTRLVVFWPGHALRVYRERQA